MKTIVTHLSPDLDAISSSWLLKRYRPHWHDADIKFVPAGTTLGGLPADSDPNIAHVDTGRGLFDHHQFNDNNTCAAKRVFDWLKKEGHIPPPHLEALERIIDYAVTIDNFKEAFFHDPTSDIYEFSLHQVIGGVKATGLKDIDLLNYVFTMLDGLLLIFRNKIKAESEIKNGLTFESKWGRALAIESPNEEAIKLALKGGYMLVIRKDPKSGAIRIKSFPKDEIDLTPVYKRVKELDPKASWFLHGSLHMLLNGSSKNPDSVPSSLTLPQVVEIIRKI